MGKSVPTADDGLMHVSGQIRRTPLLAAAVAAFVVVFVVALVVDDPAQAITVLYVVPIALVALSAGVRGGVIAACIATALLGIWVLAQDVDLKMAGWASRVIAFFMIGLLVGRYEELDRVVARRSADERAAAEVQDGVVQSLVVASYELRRGEVAAGQEAVDAALASAKQMISSRLGDVQPGDLRRTRPDDEPPVS